jgi:mannan polymerase II complex ANP1 subunit
MAKRMSFSVVGLPHYTIWHLYEPSIDDIRHMEEMEKERKEKEAKEIAEKERIEKIKAQFDNPSNQWDQDQSDIRNMAKKEYIEKEKQKDADNTEKKPSELGHKPKVPVESEKPRKM